ncbi:hypothetical protein BDV41DRAFT_525977 [Aspergillus transmontanensis]|uniref:Uncharacterized protein n=1 Tax=Aspergillus transmontanensis TaxID=1034304 RepID=A0A5N6W9Z2_9EURO|nr:hypothetical protein BDV41DRAFT_525977 [Aspergillus transmontanensis]
MKYQAPETFFQLVLGIIFPFWPPSPQLFTCIVLFRDPVKLSLSVGILFFFSSPFSLLFSISPEGGTLRDRVAKLIFFSSFLLDTPPPFFLSSNPLLCVFYSRSFGKSSPALLAV